MTARQAPRLSSHGYATIYLILPPGSFREEYNHVIRVLAPLPDQPQGIVSEAPEVLYLLGQARFAARVEASDYRDVLKRAYPHHDSKALVSNSVFSIPYVREVKRKFAHTRTDPGMIRFLTHLRVRRTVYANAPVMAESLIIERLRELTEVLDGEISIEAGLGWADFIISGVVHPKKFNAFLRLLVEFNRVRIDAAIGGAECVFKRSLTLLGYAWTGTHQPPVIDQKMSALMFIRARPGRLSAVEGLLTEAFPDTDVAFVDGKIDVIAAMRQEKRQRFFEEHEKLSEITGPECIEKFETHIIFGHELFAERKDDSPLGAPFDGGDCGCAERWRHPHYEVDALPPSLTNAIKNIEFLFSSTMRDPANCCDARTAILACERSLKLLLHAEMESKIVMNDAANPPGEGHQEANAVLSANAAAFETLLRIDRWVQTSERILRQRTVGSFEEFLGQSDRAVSYRGGAQKVLTVADNLMNDLWAKLMGLDRPEPSLTSLYDSVDRIQLVVGTGLVRMPVRALFFLPGVVPDLWHEVGGFHFFRTVTAADLGLDLTHPMDEILYRDLADNYGDLVSFLYGFKLNREQFAIALIEGWLDSQPYKKSIPYHVQQPSYVHIVARIVAVFEFLMEKAEERAKRENVDVPRATFHRKTVLLVLYEEVCEIAKSCSGRGLPEPSPALEKSVLDVLLSTPLQRGLEFLRGKLDKDDVEDAANALELPESEGTFNFGEPATLPSFTPESDLNDEFRKLYWAVTKARKSGDRPNAFAFTAALTRGAALEYHRRATLAARSAP